MLDEDRERRDLAGQNPETMPPGNGTSNGAQNGHGHDSASDIATHPSSAAAHRGPETPARAPRFLPLAYSAENSTESVIRLVTTLYPDWADAAAAGKLELVRFTDGITNTLLKAVNRALPTKDESDSTAILLRAYGNGTDRIIDRQREAQNHELLSGYGLAPQLLARFENGMLYRFILGAVTQPEDLRRKPISLAIARRLAEWHTIVPCLPASTDISALVGEHDATHVNSNNHGDLGLGVKGLQERIDNVAPGKPSPNLWTVLQKWILALPTETEAQRHTQTILQRELVRMVDELNDRPSIGENGLVFAHTDLLSGNVIVLPKTSVSAKDGTESVHFIDYEYATPSPAAFDIANHFAEWGGFDCDFNVLPTRAQRHDFIREYVRKFLTLADNGNAQSGDAHLAEEEHTAQMMAEVDMFRGIPGFYWGVWAFIQAEISDIDFDYASYAEIRLGEYWAWRAEQDGSRAAKGDQMPVRERRWAQEE